MAPRGGPVVAQGGPVTLKVAQWWLGVARWPSGWPGGFSGCPIPPLSLGATGRGSHRWKRQGTRG